jgi:Phosphoenolpyruvate carboxykinase (GTP)
MTKELPSHLIDWKGNDWTPASGAPAAHPNARFTAPAKQCPSIDPNWEDPRGVPISAFIFGGRVSKNFPLIFQGYDWEHGVFLAATMGSEATAAAIGQAAMRRDPMAMLPFCGYNMADYWRHWLKIGRSSVATPPLIFRVNWFRKDENGKFIWPGYGENMRALKWIVDRCHGRAHGVDSPLGWLPPYEALNWDGLTFSPEKYFEIMNINRELGQKEAEETAEFFAQFGKRMPRELELERELLLSRLNHSPSVWELSKASARAA